MKPKRKPLSPKLVQRARAVYIRMRERKARELEFARAKGRKLVAQVAAERAQLAANSRPKSTLVINEPVHGLPNGCGLPRSECRCFAPNEKGD